MAGTQRRWSTALVAIGLLVGAIGLVVPWWSVELSGFGAQVDLDARPFDPGLGGEDIANGPAVILSGLLVTASLLLAAADLILRGVALQREEPFLWLAPRLSILAGAVLILAALTAVWTWPAEDLSFWGSQTGNFGGFTTAAGTGWYLTIAAGATLATGGWLGLPHAEDRGGVLIEYTG